MMVRNKWSAFVAGYMENMRLFGDTSNVSSFKQLNHQVNDDEGQIVKIDCTDNSCYLLTDTGHVYTPVTTFEYDNVEPVDQYGCLIRVPLQEKVIDVTCGGNFVHFITSNYRIYTAGMNTKYKLGLSDDTSKAILTQLNPEHFHGEKITLISSTDHYTLYMNAFGTRLFASGEIVSSTSGEPIRDILPYFVQQAIENDGVTITQISSGSEHSLVLLSNNQVLGIGKDANSQLSLHHSLQYIELPERPISVYAGSYHSFFTCASGSVYACGYGSDHRLGVVTPQDNSAIHRVNIFDESMPGAQIIHIIGRISTVFVVRYNGEIYLFSVGRR
jgi:alpha-tubulin suppressor-like RCC1 family protein